MTSSDIDCYYKSMQSEISNDILNFESLNDAKKIQNGMSRMQDGTRLHATIAEHEWHLNHRAYYKLWPSILKSFLKIDLNINAQLLDLPLFTCAIRFCAGQEPQCGNYKILSLLVACLNFATTDNWNRTVQMNGILQDKNHTECYYLFNPFRMIENRTLEWFITKSNNNLAPDPQLASYCLRIAITLLLLKNDPFIIQPDVLAADRNRFDRSTDPEERQRLIDKAKRRGIVGWRIGEQYETMPHYRRPHFGLRHTGKGKTIPRIVPIKGAIVHRQKMTTVPTGYLTEDGVEIED
jgi:hypothetical protein